eukprot:GAHX01001125.1.p1 GENE.GAHX01001125.1~~GAHX01001125.1.p1  ORF type:complete len:494 (+),score=50.70 GAHX01001125.1:136-1617(+)
MINPPNFQQNTYNLVAVQNTVIKLDTAPSEYYRPPYKYSMFRYIISGSFLLISTAIALYNHFSYNNGVVSLSVYIFLFGFFAYIPILCILFFAPFFLHKITRGYLLPALLIVFDLLAVIFLIMLFKISTPVRIYIRIVIIVLGVNTSAHRALEKHKLRKHLFHVSTDILYKSKTLIFKRLIKSLLAIGLVTYYSALTMTLHVVTLFTVVINSDLHDIIVPGMCAFFGLIVLISCLWGIMSIKGKEMEFIGYLLCINSNKRIFKNRADYYDTNASKETDATDKDFKKSIEDAKKKKLQKDFFRQPKKPMRFSYGITPQQASLNTHLTISKELFNAIGYHREGFPEKIFKTKGSFVFSHFYDVNMQQATNICIASSFNGGFLKLLNQGYRQMFVSCINGTLGAIFWILPCVISYIFVKDYFEMEINEELCRGLVGFVTLISCFTITAIINRVIYGYGEALLYLIIDGKAKLSETRKHEKNLVEYLNKKCEYKKII